MAETRTATILQEQLNGSIAPSGNLNTGQQFLSDAFENAGGSELQSLSPFSPQQNQEDVTPPSESMINQRDINTLMTVGSSLSQAALGFQNIEEATDLKVAGARRSQNAFQDLADFAIKKGKINSTLEQIQTDRVLNAKQREFALLNEKNKIGQAMSNLRSSQSFLQVSNEALNVVSRDILRIREDLDQRQENIMFSAAQRETAALQKKQQAKFQEKVFEFQEGLQKAKAVGGIAKSIGSLASSAIIGDAGGGSGSSSAS